MILEGDIFVISRKVYEKIIDSPAGKSINFHYFGTGNGINLHSFDTDNGIYFCDFCKVNK